MNRRSSLIIIAAFFTIFIAYAIRYGYGMLLPEMLQPLALSKAEAGAIFTIYFMAYSICSPVVGRISDRCSMRLLLTVFVSVLALGAFLMSYSTSFGTACIFFVLAGVGHAACWTPVVALIQRWVDDRRRGLALTLADLGSATGIALMSAVMPLIVDARGWRAAWQLLGGLAFGVALLNFMLVRNPPQETHNPGAPSADGTSFQKAGIAYALLLRNSFFWFIGLSYLLMGFAVIIPFTFLTTFAVQELHLSFEAGSRLLTVVGISAVVGKALLGPLSDLLGRSRVMLLCGILITCGNGGLAFFRTEWVLLLSSAVFGLGYGAVWPVYAASAADYFSRASAGTVVGAWTLFLGLGSMLSPLIAGWLIDATGSFAWAFVVAFSGSATSLFLLWPVIRASSQKAV